MVIQHLQTQSTSTARRARRVQDATAARSSSSHRPTATLPQVMRYILEVNEHVEPEELQGLLERDLGPDAKDAIMTAGQRLIEQGRQQGIEQGRQQGRQQGI